MQDARFLEKCRPAYLRLAVVFRGRSYADSASAQSNVSIGRFSLGCRIPWVMTNDTSYRTADLFGIIATDFEMPHTSQRLRAALPRVDVPPVTGTTSFGSPPFIQAISLSSDESPFNRVQSISGTSACASAGTIPSQQSTNIFLQADGYYLEALQDGCSMSIGSFHHGQRAYRVAT